MDANEKFKSYSNPTYKQHLNKKNMSGHSGGGGGPIINSPITTDSCERLTIMTYLSSPKADVIDKVKVNDILSISALSDQGPIVATTAEGKIAGSILSSEQVRLLNCINSGTEYEAIVLSIQGGSCEIRIKAI